MRGADTAQTIDIKNTLSPDNRDEGVFQACIVMKGSSWYNCLGGYANHTRGAAVSLHHRKEGEQFTYGDYLEWNDDERWELIKGVPYNVTPAPSVSHQLITGELYRQFANHLLGKKCRAIIAPFDVRLPENSEKDEEIITVVQPDLSVVCDPSMLDERGCRGGPDLVVEILSPSTAKKDVTLKLTCYEGAGVKECWIVHPGEKMVMIYRRDESGQFGRPAVYSSEDKINVEFLDGLVITLDTVFSA